MNPARVLPEYRRRLQAVADRYSRIVDPDRGFGLTETQGTSIVNTSEALFVLRAAMRHQLTVDTTLVTGALGYIAVCLVDHCRPRTEGGRGPKARFVSFALEGLTYWPEELRKAHFDAVRFGLDWYKGQMISGPDGGIPEEAGVADPSLFQTALAVSALSQVIQLRGLDSAARARCESLLAELCRACLYWALPNCTWPRQIYQSRTSPAKTALMCIALHAARSTGHLDGVQDFAGSSSDSGRLDIDQFLGQSARWLRDHVGSWRGVIEADPDVTGTQWHHMSYALCLKALADLAEPLTPSSAAAWNDILTWWDRERASWTEPTNPRLATVRADFVAVSALEAFVQQHGAQGFVELQRMLFAAENGDPTAGTLIKKPLGQYLLELSVRREVVPLNLTPKQQMLVDVLVSRHIAQPGTTTRQFVSTADVAAALACRLASVGKYVERVNLAVSNATGVAEPLIASRRGLGYRLNVDEVRYDNTDPVTTPVH